MELVRSRSVPSLQTVADISWPRVPANDLCLGRAASYASNSTDTFNPIVSESAPHTSSSRRTLRRFGLKKRVWPNPELSLGYRCSSVGGNDCWEAIGPAKDLFSSIAKPIKDLPEARIDEPEEGQNIVGGVLTYSMYMVGKDPSVATPLLLFVCRNRKERKRAVKYVKESKILKPHPEVRLADCSIPPSLFGKGFLELLSMDDMRSGNTTLATSILMFIGEKISSNSTSSGSIVPPRMSSLDFGWVY
jgi:hypothetical protein